MICERCFLSSEQLAVTDTGSGAWCYWCKDCRVSALNLWSEVYEESRTEGARLMAQEEAKRYANPVGEKEEWLT